MKKIISVLMVCLLAVALTACGSNDKEKKASDNNDKAKTSQAQKKQEKQMKEMQKKLEAQKVGNKKVVATVNNEKIKGKDYNQALSSSQMQMQQMGQDPSSKEAAKQIKKQTIESLIGQSLIMQDAKKKGYKASSAEVNAQLEKTKKQYKGEKNFTAALKQANLSESQLKAQIAEGITSQKYIDKEVPADTVTDKEIQDYYNQYAKQGTGKGQKPPKLEEVKPQIKQQLEQQKKQEKLMSHVKSLKKNAKIDIKI
ncbi:SurA N-terminal domain-containing protein [Fictibacillus sp. WQ 8-8]|uniref:peptidylprolyl isomerase n=1 Tax=Fictibacillus marinisediminis TaxID=2878389 RepID=A0A9X1X9A0_9BACL|nr:MULTISPECIES: SurA N-terminal domain-containing protein [Fictibacillus]MCK6256263.1 SurA N-terminal domain-containing protein [Fictibacillus marinisediminis]MCQ6267630.1 SurA N-terminal domain-containing protein [Fictibacillus sp. WQ 8-8]